MKYPAPMPAHLAEQTVEPMSTDLDCPLLFSALPTAEAREWESRLAGAGYAVFSNAGAHRMDADVPLLIPEVNPEHIDIIASNTRTDRARNVATIDLTVVMRGMDQLSRLLHRIGGLANVYAVRRRG